jgi:hypothetical protein
LGGLDRYRVALTLALALALALAREDNAEWKIRERASEEENARSWEA